jgi:hypothetical protein
MKNRSRPLIFGERPGVSGAVDPVGSTVSADPPPGKTTVIGQGAVSLVGAHSTAPDPPDLSKAICSFLSRNNNSSVSKFVMLVFTSMLSINSNLEEYQKNEKCQDEAFLDD